MSRNELLTAWRLLSAREPPSFKLIPSSIPLEALRSEAAESCEGIEQDDIEDIYYCTPFQEGLMTYTTTNAYIARMVMTLRDDVDVQKLRDSFQRMADSAPILRTRIIFSSLLQRMVQVVVREKPEWELLDSPLHLYLEHDATRSMEMGERLQRCSLVNDESTGKKLFVWTIHHAIYDGWSVALMAMLWQQGYESPRQRLLATKYNSFVEHIMTMDHEAASSFWTSHLSNAQPSKVPIVPHPRAQAKSNAMHRLDVTFDTTSPAARNSDLLGGLARGTSSFLGTLIGTPSQPRAPNVPMPSIAQAAWVLLMSRYEDTDQITLGTTLSGRRSGMSTAQTVVGPMVATLPVHFEVPASQRLQDFVQLTKNRVKEVTQFCQFGLTRISKLSPEARRAVDLQNILVIQSSEWSYSMGPIGKIDRERSQLHNDKTAPLVVECTVSKTGAEIVAHYNTNEVPEDWVACLCDEFGSLMSQMLNVYEENPLIQDMDVVCPKEIEQMRAWNATTPDPVASCLHDLVHLQRLKRPEAQAVWAWDGHLTYRELDDLAERLADYLVTRGVGPEKLVAICLDKSRWAVVTMLAILKAGGVVVPINAAYPASRIRELTSDATVTLVDGRHAARLGSELPDLICVNSHLVESLPLASCHRRETVLPSNAAWVIYTSGSTGTPKRIVLQHSALVTSILAQGQGFSLDSDSRIVQYSAYTFDVSIGDIFGALLHSGCVCVISEESRMNDLAGAMESARVNVAILTSTVVDTMLKPALTPSVKRLVLCAEPVKPALLELWRGKAVLYGAYGPAECSIQSTIGRFLDQDNVAANVGSAICGRLWVVDASNRNLLCPLGAVGELLIEGPHLARGYLNDEEKTAASFISAPDWVARHGFDNADWPSPEPRAPQRFYCTGDLVRRNQDGSLIIVGRRDTQIKIHGQRVETGEIEHWIKKMVPSAGNISVDLIRPPNRSPMLAAAIEVDAELDAEAVTEGMINMGALPLPDACLLRQLFQDLSDGLSKSVPAYMVPSLYVPFITLPQTSSGKLDRRAVRERLAAQPEEELNHYLLGADKKNKTPPSTETERSVQALWKLALNMPTEDIFVQDDFFRLGGDSVGAIRLAALARERRIPLKVADIFEHPRLEEMAAFADQQGRWESSSLPSATLTKDLAPFELWRAGFGDTPEEQVAQAQELEKTRLAMQCQVEADMIEDVYPCTPLQEGLLTLSARKPKAYMAQYVFRANGSLDEGNFIEAWQKLCDAAPILRTRIALSSSGKALQVVVRGRTEWRHETLSLNEYLHQDRSIPMGYGSPLLRFAMIYDQEAPDQADKGSSINSRRYFVWTAHHSTYDGWSARQLFKMLTTLYMKRSLPSITPFNHFVQYLENSDQDAAKEYWCSQFDGNEKEMPAVFPRPPEGATGDVGSSTGRATHRMTFEFSSQSQVTTTMRGESATMTAGTILRAAWALVLSEQTGSDNVVFGVPLSGRSVPLRGIMDVVGPTIATVPVRIRIDRSQTVRQYLETVQQQAIKMMPYEQTGLQNIRRLLASADKGGDYVDMQHLFVVQPATEREGQIEQNIPGLEALPVFLEGFHDTPLLVECNMEPDGSVNLEAYYNEHIVPPQQARRLLHQLDISAEKLYRVVSELATIGKRQEPCLSDIDLITPEEIDQLRLWDERISPDSEPACIHDLVHEQRLRHAEAPAIWTSDGYLTFEDLEDRAGRLAAHLRSFGVKSETPVMICFKKSSWAVVSMLAILKAGGVIVPVGTQYPLQRIEVIVQETSCRLMLADDGQATRLSGLVHSTLCVDESLLEKVPDRSESHWPVSPRDAAYILFTSGSTGTPKGVVLEHGGLSGSLLAQGKAFGLNPDIRIVQFAAYTFDISILDIFGSLIFGSCLCIISEEMRLDNLPAAMKEARVNCAVLTPTVADTLKPEMVPTLRTLILVGETIKPLHIETWSSRVRLFNGYGPSEASILATCTSAITGDDRTSNIGFPIWGGAWIVKPAAHYQLCPIGVAGELLLEGPGLARGYLNDNVKTASSFVDDPAWVKLFPKAGACKKRRFYRTGDLVRQNDDGSLTFIGRLDTQIKVHGQRVETGEIEHWIKQKLPIVHSVAVDLVHFRGRCHDPILIAAMDMADSATRDAGNADKTYSLIMPISEKLRYSFLQLSSSLTETLPFYMVPTLFVPFANLPLSSSGKLDRRAIRLALESLDEEEVQQYYLTKSAKTAPSTETEVRVQGLWAEAIKISTTHISANDDFFRIGGDSVAAMRLAALARDKQGISLSVADIFKHPRLSDIAALVDQRQAEAPVQDVAPFELWEAQLADEPEERASDLDRIASQCQVSVAQIEDVFPCTPLQEGLLTLSAQHPQRYMPQHVFRLDPSRLDVQHFQATWERLFEAIRILRTRIVLSVSSRRTMQAVIAEPIYWTRAHNLEEYLASDRAKPTGFGVPLTRYALIDDGQSSPHFVWTAHHSVYDGWSSRRLFELLIEMHKGQVVPHVAPFTRFVSYVGRSNDEAASSFWRSQYTGNRSSAFPTLPRPLYQPYTTGRCLRQMKLMTLSSSRQRAAITTAILLRAAWALVVSQAAGEDDVIFGVPLSGRTAPVPDILDMVGPTITTVPVRVQIAWDTQSIRDYLSMVQQQAVDMIPFEHVGLQHIRRLVGVDDYVHVNHLFIVQPTLGGEEALETAIPGLEALPVDLEGFDGYALTVQCIVDGEDGSVALEARYDNHVVSDALAQSLLRQLDNVTHQLHAVAIAPDDMEDASLRSLELVDAEEIQRLKEWNNRPLLEAFEPACVHDLVRKQTLQRPQAQAVWAWDGHLTYQDLHDLSQQLAHHLVGHGIGPEKKVALCFDKSRWAVVSMLAVLKAGGAIVPIGARDHIERKLKIIEVAEVSIVLADEQLGRQIVGIGATVVCISQSFFDDLLNKDPSRVERDAAETPVCTDVKPDNAAFILFTSGSTGIPKGVVLEHAAICASLFAQGKAYGFNADTRMLQFAAYTFDVSIFDIFGAWLHGGCICVIPEEARMNNLAGAMETARVNTADLTPTVASLLRPSEVQSLKTLILAGEAVEPTVVERWAPCLSLFNGYGPTEASMATTCLLKSSDETPSIGSALYGALWVVDPSNRDRLCPLGAVGELLIEGPGLARGYLNDVGKTRNSFITDPAWVTRHGFGAGRRMYCTGDLVRRRDDGSLLYLGRRDTQIKVHGQRLEAGEVEHYIKDCWDAVQTIAVELVHLHSKDSSAPVLAAAVELSRNDDDASGGCTPAKMTDSLRQAIMALPAKLADKLPAYMTPTLFVPFTRLPLTASNKVDRRSVRKAIESIQNLSPYCLTDNPAEKIAPSTHTETSLQRLWAAALDIAISTEIFANDDFFGRGGDSVAAMGLAALARDEGMVLSVADIFAHQRLADMARLIDERHSDKMPQEEDNVAPFDMWRAEFQSQSEAEQELALATIAAQCRVGVDQIEDLFPCTPLQEGLLSLSAQQPERYTAQHVFVVSSIDEPRFKHAWEKVAETAPILRTRIVRYHSAKTMQAVIREPINWVEATGLETYLAQSQSQVREYGSSLTQWAMVSDNDYGRTEKPCRYFVWTVHHSLYDGWTMARLFDAVAKAYDEQPIPSTVPFTRFVRHLSKTDETAAGAFWQSQFRGDTIATSFPIMPASFQGQAYTNGVASRTIKLSDSSQDLTTTLANILRAAWSLVVSQWTGSNDIVFGAPLSGRTCLVAGIMDIMGPTITTVPIRVRIDRSQFVEGFLAMIQQQAVDMWPFEHTGLQHIKRLVQMGQDCHYAELQHLFVVQPPVQSSHNLAIPGLESIELPHDGFSGYALTLECRISSGMPTNVEVEARYDQRVISDHDAAGLISHLEHFTLQLRDAVAEPTNSQQTGLCLADMQTLCPDEMNQLMLWNKHQTPDQIAAGQTACLHDLIQDHVLRRPDAQAVWAWDGHLTYRELDDLADKLAHHLADLGLGVGHGSEKAVAVCFDKSRWAIVAMLAVLKAGGVVVPIGVQYPLQRAISLIQQADCVLLLADERHSTRLANSLNAIQCPTLQVDGTLIGSLPKYHDRSMATVQPSQAAFIIFTSGSTGTPKGVVMEHGCLSQSIKAHGKVYGLSPETRILQFAAYTFDASIGDIFGGLLHGSCVVVIPEDARLNNVAAAMESARVNLAILTPTMAALLQPRDVPHLKTLILVGEELKEHVLETWVNSVRLLNAYGPSEACISTTSTQQLVSGSPASNIGFALCGSLWVVDPSDYHQLCPAGVVGELLIEGPLARGYLKDDEKTSASFVRDPKWVKHYNLEPGRRMFLTGDLVRRNHDGSLTYLRRKNNDGQVKVHGQRVEIGEIEHHLTTHPAVFDSVVVFPRKGPAASQLVGFLCLRGCPSSGLPGDAGFTIATMGTPGKDDTHCDLNQAVLDVRLHLSRNVMDYMVPSAWIPLETLPVNASGKIDRLCLQEWLEALSPDDLQRFRNLGQSPVDDLSLSPQDSDMVDRIRDIWASVLGIPAEAVPVAQSFLSLGGDSITAMQVVSRCRSAGLGVTVRDVLRSQSIAHMSHVVVLHDTPSSGDSLLSWSSKPSTPPQTAEYKPFQFMGGVEEARRVASLSLEPLLPESATLDDISDNLPTTETQAFYATSAVSLSRMSLNHFFFDAPHAVDMDRITSSCQTLVSHHQSLRTVYFSNQQDGALLQAVLRCHTPSVAMYEVDSIESYTHELLKQDMHAPPQLGQPFVQFAVLVEKYRLGFRLIMRICHADYDAASSLHYFKTFSSAYASQALPECGSFSQYMSLVLAQHSSLPAKRFWSTLLQGSSMTQIGSPRTRISQVPSLVEAIETEIMTAGGDSIPSPGASMATMVKAAWACVLAACSSVPDVVFGDLVSGRNVMHGVAENADGCCINIVPLRVKFQEDWTLEDLLHYIEEQQFSRAPFELLGMRSIQRECTNYPTSTTFSSVVNHQYRQESTSNKIGDFVVSAHVPAISGGVAIVLQTYSSGGHLRIRIVYETNRVSCELADGLIQALRTTMEVFLRVSSTDILDYHSLTMPFNLSDLAAKSVSPSETQDDFETVSQLREHN